jgi:ribose transport system permease protein
LITILLSISVFGIAAVGQTQVIISGGLDLSQESVISAAAVMVTLLYKAGAPLSVSIFTAILCGALVGLVNGVFVTKVRINPIITTLATMAMVRGINGTITNDLAIPIRSDAFSFIARGFALGKFQLPLAVIMLIVIFLTFHFILKYTTFGRRVYAIGGNEQACIFAGINVERNRITLYILSGVLSAVSGLILASISGAGYPYGAQGYIINILTAVFLGGTALTGGRGRLVGTFFGVLIIGIINNGLQILSIVTYLQLIFIGVALLAAVAVSQMRVREV